MEVRGRVRAKEEGSKKRKTWNSLKVNQCKIDDERAKEWRSGKS